MNNISQLRQIWQQASFSVSGHVKLSTVKLLAALGLVAVPASLVSWQLMAEPNYGEVKSENEIVTPNASQILESSLNDSTADERSSGSQNSSSVSQSVSVFSKQDSSSGGHTSVDVNGKRVEVPQNGEVHKTIRTEGGQTVVDISSKHNQSSNAGSSSSVTMKVESHSSSSSGSDHD